MYRDRVPLYRELERACGSKLLVYITGDRRGLEAKIHREALDLFADHLELETVGEAGTISLLLYSRGGSTVAGWSLVNLIRQHCKRFEVIVPAKAHSAATLICLGADAIIMTRQATLGPIDPSVNGPLNPKAQGDSSGSTIPVSVEDVAGFMDLARKELGVKSEAQLVTLLTKLAEHVHPLTLGKVYRSRMQIQQLAERLLDFHWKGPQQRKQRIVTALCTESGSHDYTISLQEAKESLGLPVKMPSPTLSGLIRGIYLDIRNELELFNPFDPATLLGVNQQVSYACKQALIESLHGGSHYFVKEGTVVKGTPPEPSESQPAIQHHVTFSGWRHDRL